MLCLPPECTYYGSVSGDGPTAEYFSEEQPYLRGLDLPIINCRCTLVPSTRVDSTARHRASTAWDPCVIIELNPPYR